VKNLKKLTALLLVAALVFSLTGCSIIDYKKAVKAMEAGSYAEASEMFKALGDYKDSAEKAKECDYEVASAQLADGDYLAAREGFRALGDYSDSAAKALACTDSIVLAALEGEWQSTEIDLLDELINGISIGLAAADNMAKAMLEKCSFEHFNLTITMKCSDGKAEMAIDEEKLNSEFDYIADTMATAMTDYLSEYIEQECEKKGFTLKTVFTLLGVDSMDQLLEQYIGMPVKQYAKNTLEQSGAIEQAKESINVQGSYSVKDGEVSFSLDGGEEPAVYDEASEVLTLTGAENDETGYYPITFTKR